VRARARVSAYVYTYIHIYYNVWSFRRAGNKGTEFSLGNKVGQSFFELTKFSVYKVWSFRNKGTDVNLANKV
jgi:hypothetical protein